MHLPGFTDTVLAFPFRGFGWAFQNIWFEQKSIFMSSKRKYLFRAESIWNYQSGKIDEVYMYLRKRALDVNLS